MEFKVDRSGRMMMKLAAVKEILKLKYILSILNFAAGYICFVKKKKNNIIDVLRNRKTKMLTNTCKGNVCTIMEGSCNK